MTPVDNETSAIPVWAGVLAAGEGRRLGGRPKALLRWRGRTFLETIADAAREGGAAGVAVVLGYHAEEVRELAEGVCDQVTLNPNPDRGMVSSAREVAKVVPEGTALLLWPVDIPSVRPETVRALIEASRSHPGRVVAPAAVGALGHPPLLPPDLVAELRELGDQERLDRFIEARGGVVVLELGDAGVLRDVDLAKDLDRLPD